MKEILQLLRALLDLQMQSGIEASDEMYRLITHHRYKIYLTISETPSNERSSAWLQEM